MAWKKIEVFSAGCPTCREAVETVKRIAGSNHDMTVLNMHQGDVAARAKRLGIRSVPTVLVDGQIACCVGHGIDEDILKSVIRPHTPTASKGVQSWPHGQR